MRSNGLLKWLMIPVALLVLFFGIRLFSGGGSSAPSQAETGSQLTPEEMKALGIAGDTPRDTVATLVAQVKQLRTELQIALSDNKSQREENQRLRQRENSIDQRINSALETERSNLRRDQQQAASERQQTEGLLADLQQRLDSIGGRGAAIQICLWAWGCATATRPEWKAACAGWIQTIRSPSMDAMATVARVAATTSRRASARRRARWTPRRKPCRRRVRAPPGPKAPNPSIPCRRTRRSWGRWR